MKWAYLWCLGKTERGYPEFTTSMMETPPAMYQIFNGFWNRLSIFFSNYDNFIFTETKIYVQIFSLPPMGAGFSPNNSSAELINTTLAVHQLLMLSYFPPFQIWGKSTPDFLSKWNVHLSHLNTNTSVANYSKVGLETFYELIIVHCTGRNLNITSWVMAPGVLHRILPGWISSSASTASWLGLWPFCHCPYSSAFPTNLEQVLLLRANVPKQHKQDVTWQFVRSHSALCSPGEADWKDLWLLLK